MSGPEAREALPATAREVAAFLSGRGLPDWPPGRTFLARDAGGGIAAVARVGAPSPGDGYHCEHVRTLWLEGAPEALPAVAATAARAAEADLAVGRLESEVPAPTASLRAVLTEAGLAHEASLPRGWRTAAGEEQALETWGRVLGAARPCDVVVRDEFEGPAPLVPDDERLRIVEHGQATRPALADFLAALAPGRAYPAGTLLSEAERVETRRSRDLDARWVLAVTPDGCVAGGVVLAPDARPGRAHVRSVHLDVRPEWRRRGVATRLLHGAFALARNAGIACLEADPRAGNAGAIGALARAGFRRAGTLRAAWRLRGTGRARDEDVLLLWAATDRAGG